MFPRRWKLPVHIRMRVDTFHTDLLTGGKDRHHAYDHVLFLNVHRRIVFGLQDGMETGNCTPPFGLALCNGTDS